MMELRHLRYFVAVAEELHFGRAAERLHMAQSPLSHQIRQLERSLGVQLLVRGHHVVGLTNAGSTLLPLAQRVLQDVDGAARAARRAGRGEAGAVVVGYVSEVTADLLPITLRRFKQRWPDVAVELVEGTGGELAGGLRDGSIDVAFARAPEQTAEFCFEQLIVERLLLAQPEQHAGGNDPVALAALADERFVLPSPAVAPGLWRDIGAALTAAGVEVTIAREATSLTALLLLVAAGEGVALVPAATMHVHPVPGVRFAPVADAAAESSGGVVWRADERSPAVGHLLDTTREVAAQHQSGTEVWPDRLVTGA